MKQLLFSYTPASRIRNPVLLPALEEQNRCPISIPPVSL
jgi:hypothetical protein